MGLARAEPRIVEACGDQVRCTWAKKQAYATWIKKREMVQPGEKSKLAQHRSTQKPKDW